MGCQPPWSCELAPRRLCLEGRHLPQESLICGLCMLLVGAPTASLSALPDMTMDETNPPFRRTMAPTPGPACTRGLGRYFGWSHAGAFRLNMRALGPTYGPWPRTQAFDAFWANHILKLHGHGINLRRSRGKTGVKGSARDLRHCRGIAFPTMARHGWRSSPPLFSPPTLKAGVEHR